MKMTHREEMEYLKEHDPILYSELTSDPTGAGGYSDGCSFLPLVDILFVIAGFVLYHFFAA